MIPWPPVGHDDVLSAAQMGARADRAGPAQHRIGRRLRVSGGLVRGLVHLDILVLLHACVHLVQLVPAHGDLTGASEVQGECVFVELIGLDEIVPGGRAIGLGPGLLGKVALGIPPQMHAALVGLEDIVYNAIVLAVFNVHAAALQSIGHVPVADKMIVCDERVLGIAAPHTADRILDQAVAVEDVAKGEGHFNTMGRRIGEIILDEKVSVVAASLIPCRRMGAGFTQGFAPGKAEEAVPAVCGGVFRDDVVAVLLKHEDAGRVLSAVVHTVTVAAHAEVTGISCDEVVAASPHGNAPARVEREVVVVDFAIGDAIEYQGVLTVPDPAVVYDQVIGVFYVDRGPVVDTPFILVVVVRVEPVAAILGCGR